MNKFQESLAYLDAFLTRKSWREVKKTAQDQNFTPEKLLSEIYYLSDGGYSRIALNESTGKLFLTSVSLDGPKQNWKYVKELKEDIERSVQTYCIAMGYPNIFKQEKGRV